MKNHLVPGGSGDLRQLFSRSTHAGATSGAVAQVMFLRHAGVPTGKAAVLRHRAHAALDLFSRSACRLSSSMTGDCSGRIK